ncbi:hypothetical protein [Flexibacterium corallicola]|uniref:hypothetical protein n=1 Tax=Flexibacterium corallicola TaxID=3037259 RepID=UPI00286EEADE|nr:hypothetical protein [Pseudovibrio sp. M1P-2-3]
MTSYLIDGFVLFALAITTWRVVVMYRQLKILSSHHEDYKRIFDQTSDAMEQIGVSLQELKVRGEEIITTLGKRIDEANQTKADMNTIIAQAQAEMRDVQAGIEALKREARKAGGMTGRLKNTEGQSYHIPDELGGEKDEKGRKKQVKSVAQMLASTPKKTAQNEAVSAVDNQSLRVRKVSFGQGVGFRSVNKND